MTTTAPRPHRCAWHDCPNQGILKTIYWGTPMRLCAEHYDLVGSDPELVDDGGHT